MLLAVLEWSFGVLVVLGGGVLGFVATRRGAPWLGAIVVVPVVLGAIVTGARIAPPAPGPAFRFALDAAWVLLAVVGGAPVVQLVLGRTRRDDVREGVAGGILIDRAAGTLDGAVGSGADRTADSAAEREPMEVLRGGGTIGYLERFAAVAGIGLGQVAVIGALIALKGLGRFGELGAAAARERFIIGTLASLIWASCCGALIGLG